MQCFGSTTDPKYHSVSTSPLRRSIPTTAQPLSINSLAHASPMPEAAPVTRALGPSDQSTACGSVSTMTEPNIARPPQRQRNPNPLRYILLVGLPHLHPQAVGEQSSILPRFVTYSWTLGKQWPSQGANVHHLRSLRQLVVNLLICPRQKPRICSNDRLHAGERETRCHAHGVLLRYPSVKNSLGVLVPQIVDTQVPGRVARHQYN